MTPSLELALWGCTAVALACWLLSLITREYSWTDRVWSLTPPLFALCFTYEAGFDVRTLVMTGLATLWGARLTYNFARKGGYARGGEDYRWVEVQKRSTPLQYQLLNFVFIAGFQNYLLLGITLPAWVAAQHPGAPFGPVDWLLTLAFLLFLAGETWADETQWRFQQDKAARRARGEPIEQQFVTSGPFRFSRHLNFFCEQAQWWVFYGFSITAGAGWLNVSILGAAALSLLFQGSTSLTENLTVAKYPAYAEYQRRVSRLMPWFPGVTSQ
jgi:steroid 5-alpha reductase family enzyme